jgi:hypothetical protein
MKHLLIVPRAVSYLGGIGLIAVAIILGGHRSELL